MLFLVLRIQRVITVEPGMQNWLQSQFHLTQRMWLQNALGRRAPTGQGLQLASGEQGAVSPLLNESQDTAFLNYYFKQRLQSRIIFFMQRQMMGRKETGAGNLM